MQQGSGGMGSHKHSVSGHSPRSPRFKFMQQLEANKEEADRHKRPALKSTTVAEAIAQHRGNKR